MTPDQIEAELSKHEPESWCNKWDWRMQSHGKHPWELPPDLFNLLAGGERYGHYAVFMSYPTREAAMEALRRALAASGTNAG